MNLVLVCDQSLEDQQRFAMENFESVPNANAPYPDFKGTELFTEEDSFGKVFKIIPQKDEKDMELMW
jgi:secreted Zn-dependent insulinase-like peptidase